MTVSASQTQSLTDISTQQAQLPLLPDGSVNMHYLEHRILRHVFKPGRYLGFEQGAYRKPFAQAHVTMAMAFPDLYEIGISNYGTKLLYSLVNQQDTLMCDRVYAPAQDFMTLLAEHGIPLYGVESKQPLKNFDLLAVSLQYELNYTTILGILESAQIPFRSAERTVFAPGQPNHTPLLIAGGPGSANPMPLSPFFDAFIIGDGEEVLLEITDIIHQAKQAGWDKAKVLHTLAELDGLFIPGITERAKKRIVDIAKDPVKLAPLVPFVEAVHDRVVVEARRGCDRMCRFCQPCFINLPVREQSIEQITKSALEGIEATGYEECSLLSLSIADFSHLKPMVLGVSEALSEKNASLSLPSQRADRFSLEVAEAVQSVRKSSLTFAPEAGTSRLRNVINKNLTDKEIMDAVTTAYKAGWNKVKLYFIIGLPSETQEDLDGIVSIVQRLQDACRQLRREPGLSLKDHLDVNVTLSNFVPKPHTPFQWFPQDSVEMLVHKAHYLRDAFRPMRGVKVNYTDWQISLLEAVITKGDAELAPVIEGAYRRGAYLDAWNEVENFNKWFEALAEAKIDPEKYVRERLIHPDDPLPWDVIDMGLDKEWLRTEWERALEAASTVPCFNACSTCGVCDTFETWPSFIKPEEVAALPSALNEKPTKHLPKADPTHKLRLTVEKRGSLRFISQLDWLRLIHRAVLRSGLPVAYSKGFNPVPKTSFGPALPLLIEGYAERIDIELTHPVDNGMDLLNRFLPEGGKITHAELRPLPVKSIEKTLLWLSYSARWTCKDPTIPCSISDRIQALASLPDLTIEVDTRQGPKTIALGSYLQDLRLDDHGIVHFRIVKNDSGQPLVSVKPDWVLRAIDSQIDSPIEWTIARTGMGLATDACQEPVV